MTNEGWTIIGTVAGVLGLLLTCFGLIDAKKKRRTSDESASEYILDDISPFAISGVDLSPEGSYNVTITYLGNSPALNVSVRFTNKLDLVKECAECIAANIDTDDAFYNKSYDFDKNESINIAVDKEHLDSVLGSEIRFEWYDEEGRKHRVVKEVGMDINDKNNTTMKKEGQQTL